MEKKLFDTDVWVPVPMISQEQIDEGYEGGEGCQACPNIILDPVRGQLGFFGTDCAGLYKTTDGGKHWVLSTLGTVSCGAVGFAIDANNTDRVIFVGANTWRHHGNGIHLSTDAGDTWRYVYTVADTGHGMVGIHNDHRLQTAFDTTTFDEKIGGSAVVYWSREYDYINSYGGHVSRGHSETSWPAIYRSDDGGEHWHEIGGTYGFGGGDLMVNAKNGWVYVSVNHDLKEPGVYRSKDRGETFEKVLDVKPLAMDVVRTYPDNIYVSTNDGIYVSKDAGDTWQCIKGEDFPTYNPIRMRVSPADPDNIILLDEHSADQKNCWGHKVWFTRDGGKTWKTGYRDPKGSWIPTNSWEACFCWSTEKGVVISNGPWRSTDGGENFYISRAGFNGICVGGKFNWNANYPNIMAIASQDFNGGFTLDHGRTWKYVNWSQLGWGGFTYGSYMFDDKNGFTAVSKNWEQRGIISVTHDSGDTVTKTDCEMNGIPIGCGVPGDPDVGFLGEWRTPDRARTLEKMENCRGVFTFDPVTGRLFGANGHDLVISEDKGVTWKTAYSFPYDIKDIAYNHVDKTFHVVTGEGRYYRGQDVTCPCFERRDYGSIAATGVCVDPVVPSIVYIGCSCHEYDIDSTMRSLDNGDTFTCINRHPGDGRKGPSGGMMGGICRVNPETRELFVAGGCRGIWKIAPPPIEL